MTAAVLQTPLEVILFFTSLASHGVKQQSFQTISETLKKDQVVRESEGFDEARLSPESLQQLYLTLLKDEIKSQDQRRRSASPAGQENGSPGSRKRKLSSPPLQSLSDAQEHEHLLPILINKLYARYREQAVEDVLKEEENFKVLQSQLGRLNNKATNGDSTVEATTKPSPAPKQQGQGVSITGALPTNDAQRPKENHTGSLGSPAQRPIPALSSAATPAAPLVRSPAAGSPMEVDVSNASLPVPTKNQPQRSLSPQDARNPVAPQMGSGGQPLPPSATSNQPVLSQSSHSRSPGATSQGSAGQAQNPAPSLEKPLQPAANVAPSQGTPRTGVPPLGSAIVPPSTVSNSTFPSPAQGQMQNVQAQHVPPRAGYPHRGYPAPDQKQAFTSQPPFVQPGPQGAPHHSGQPIHPNYNAQPNVPIPGHGVAGQLPGYSQNAFQPPFGSSPRVPQFPGTPQQAAQQQHRPTALATPLSSTVQRRILPPLDTSASSTKWRSAGRNREKSPERPQLSPLRFDFDDSASDDDAGNKASRKSTDFESNRVTPADTEETPSRPVGRGRGGRGRAGRPTTTRGESASASTRTRTRSHSAASQAEEPSTAAHRRAGSRRFNHEPKTPAEERQSSVPSSSAGTPLPIGGRPRGNTLRSIETPPNVRPGKRKFEPIELGSPTSAGPGTPRFTQAPTKAGHVMAVKGLPRTAQTILNDVTTHKLASMFQKPISEREAPGYRDLVFQPQDLKTIKSQLSAGQKAINAASNAAQEAGQPLQPGPDAGSVWLPRSADVLPPRAIVNSSQLETEICRIFANAVMFNPDPKRGVGPSFRARAKRAENLRRAKLGKAESDDDDEDEDDADDEGGSLVDDAREMFGDVEKQLAGWRAAERASAGDGGAGLEGLKDESMAEESKDEDEAAATEGEEGRPSRRRRI